MTNSTLEPGFAPYASPNSVIDVIHRVRDRDLPDTLTFEYLGALGVPASMVSPTLRSLKFLGLVDDAGQKLPAFEQLRVASSDDYPDVLGGVVKSAYSEVFKIVDPKEDDFVKVADAFRLYSPQKQRPKMVRLFLGLCGEAGLAAEQPIRRRGQSTSRPSPPKRYGTTEDTTPIPIPSAPEPPLALPNGAKGLIQSFVAQLPDNNRWTSDHRDRWLKAVTSAVDLMITVSDSDEIE